MSKTNQSPVYDHFSSICRESGLAVVRAFHEVENEVKRSNRLIRDQARCGNQTSENERFFLSFEKNTMNA